MSNRTLKRLTTVITAAVMTLVVILGVSWKSAVQTFTKPAEVKQTTEETQAVEVKQTEATETQAAETQLATEAPPATTTVAAETLPEGAATATATTADGTPITVVVQMPEQALPQQTVQQVVQQTEDPNSEEVLTKKALAATWIHYYNGDIQANGLWEDDFNFGPNPITDGVVREASYYDAELRERLKWDPALAAAVTAWIDAAVGTRYLGVFYEAAKEDWATAINLAKLKFSADQMSYYKNLDALFAFMNSARSVEVRPCQGVTDMMYMNPYTASGIPDVIVMNTTDQTGYELIYQFVIKPGASGSSASGASGTSGASGGNSNTFEVAFRLNCGFQPTNVAEIMKITPQSEPPRTSSTGGGNTSNPTTSGGGNTSTPTPETGENPTPNPTPSTEKQTETDPDTPTPSTERQTETDPDTPTPETIQAETDPDTPTPETIQTETNPPEPTPETTQTETNPPEPTPETTQTETNPPEPTPETETPSTPTPETLPVKDPSEQHAENAEPNDNPGAGESTNNGVGAEYSTADQPENSNHYDSYEEYVEVVENLADANEGQRVGGDSNEPSYTPEVAANESPVVVDNNAGTGTATSASIDDPTPVADNLAVAANTDGEIANDPTNPGVAWEGPSD